MLEKASMASPSLFLSDFTVLDYAFVDAQTGVTGDSYFVSAELLGETDKKDFILDFSLAKKMLKALVDDAFDHRLLVPVGSGTARLSGGKMLIQCASGFSWEYDCPREAFELFPDSEINAEVLQHHLAAAAKAKLPANVREARFTLSSPARFSTEANFRYTHGLRFHDGNCQRLFHGHRNPIEVWVSGERAPKWEKLLATEWHDAHFVSAPTLVNRRALDLPLGVRQAGHPGTAEVMYQSGQGIFRALLPASRVILVENEPSIETMSELASETLVRHGLAGEFKVVAYEGLNKGAAFVHRA